MMLEIMETFPLGEWGFHSPRALHAMIEAKKLAYADMLRYVADPRFGAVPVAQLLDRARAARRAKQVDMAKAACEVASDRLAGLTDARGGDTIYLSVVDKDGNIVSLIQSIFSAFGSGIVPEGTGFALHNRGGLFTLEPGHPNTLAPRKRPLHTIIPGFMQKDGVQIGFGIMGGFNQAQAHAQFVAGIADYGFHDPGSARGRPLHQADLCGLRRRDRARARRDARSSSGSDTSRSWSRRGSPTSAGARPYWPAPTASISARAAPRRGGHPGEPTDLRRRRARTLGRPQHDRRGHVPSSPIVVSPTSITNVGSRWSRWRLTPRGDPWAVRRAKQLRIAFETRDDAGRARGQLGEAAGDRRRFRRSA
jgi:hypothetical protein